MLGRIREILSFFVLTPAEAMKAKSYRKWKQLGACMAVCGNKGKGGKTWAIYRQI